DGDGELIVVLGGSVSGEVTSPDDRALPDEVREIADVDLVGAGVGADAPGEHVAVLEAHVLPVAAGTVAVDLRDVRRIREDVVDADGIQQVDVVPVEPADVAVLSRDDRVQDHRLVRVGDVQGGHPAVVLGRRDHEDVADGEQRPRVDVPHLSLGQALDELRVRRILRVDDVHAGVRAADVDGRALPGDAPHRLGEITVVDAGDVHRLHVPRIAHVGDVPDVDPLAADGRGVEGAAVLREGDLVPLRLA